MKIAALTIKNKFLTINDLQFLSTTSKSVRFYICPFTLVLGSINTTNSGYRNNYSIPNDYSDFAKVFTGEEALIADWDNSYTITKQNNPILPSNPTKQDLDMYYGIKTFKVGDYFYGNLEADNAGINFVPSQINSNFTSEEIVKTKTLRILNIKENKFFINQIEQYYFKFFVIPELDKTLIVDKSIKKNPFYDISKQYYYLQNITTVWNKTKKEIAYIECTFVSVNDVIKKSGLAVNQYIQNGGPGEPYAFPTIEPGTNKLILDTDRLIPLPITHAQVYIYGTSAVSNFVFMGRPINVQPENVNYKIEAPRLIFPYKFQAPIYDQISFKALPQNDFYFGLFDYALDTYFKDWKSNIAQGELFDETNTKLYEGHLRSNYSNMIKSNNITPPATLHNPYWSNNFLTNKGFDSNLDGFTLNGNWLYGYLTPNINIKVNSSNNFTYTSITNKNLANFNMFNYLTQYTTYQLPFDIRIKFFIS